MAGTDIAAILTDVGGDLSIGLELTVAELPQTISLLLNSGGGALGWWRIRHLDSRASAEAQQLHHAYRLHTLQAAVKELELAQLFTYLRANGLEPLLGKGWAIARQYPELGLRPYGDFDLYVRPEEYDAYVTALAAPEARGWNVDLHCGAAELRDRSFDDLYARSELADCKGVAIRTFGSEDHLRLLCLHFLREGALRPLWLCDLAIALDSLKSDFDWDYFLRGNARRTEAAICALGLAHELLGAKLTGLPIEARAKRLPRWLAPVVLREWGSGKVTHGRRTPIAVHLRHPIGFLKSMRERWPNAIEATFRVQAPFNNWPRLPFQLWECGQRLISFVRQVPKLVRHEEVIMK